jgi:hypothetical protein
MGAGSREVREAVRESGSARKGDGMEEKVWVF